mmetsp:Transcript_83943/g.216046  ORF Transcript_83943/g.216046 Transcript_83943/m.216046 type:complete len:286 (+) Transcript_83943:431-1288(+)
MTSSSQMSMGFCPCLFLASTLAFSSRSFSTIRRCLVATASNSTELPLLLTACTSALAASNIVTMDSFLLITASAKGVYPSLSGCFMTALATGSLFFFRISGFLSIALLSRASASSPFFSGPVLVMIFFFASTPPVAEAPAPLLPPALFAFALDFASALAADLPAALLVALPPCFTELFFSISATTSPGKACGGFGCCSRASIAVGCRLTTATAAGPRMSSSATWMLAPKASRVRTDTPRPLMQAIKSAVCSSTSTSSMFDFAASSTWIVTLSLARVAMCSSVSPS